MRVKHEPHATMEKSTLLRVSSASQIHVKVSLVHHPFVLWAVPPTLNLSCLSCCGCCCDTRRAVIICNLVNIILTLIGTATAFAGIELVLEAAKTADDDATINAAKEVSAIPVGALIAIAVVNCTMYGLGVLGAISYSRWRVVCALVAYAVNFVLQLVQVNIIGAIICALFAYPHVFFIRELNSNIMSMSFEHVSMAWMFCLVLSGLGFGLVQCSYIG
jgi:hypothetical protein